MGLSLISSNTRFERLVVVKFSHADSKSRQWYWCHCDCGIVKLVQGNCLKSKNTRSCGCLMRESMRNVGLGRKTHGATIQRRTIPEYNSWRAMIDRCGNPKHSGYRNYGGRGISVCSRWRYSFEAFLQDVGSKPDKSYTIDRIDNNGNYEPSNCRWASRKEQIKNRRCFCGCKCCQ